MRTGTTQATVETNVSSGQMRRYVIECDVTDQTIIWRIAVLKEKSFDLITPGSSLGVDMRTGLRRRSIERCNRR
jgi:hypothetical protein